MRGSELRVEWRCSAGPYGDEHAELWIGQESLGAEESYTLSLDQVRRFRLFVVHNDFDGFEQLLMSVLKPRGGAYTAHLIAAWQAGKALWDAIPSVSQWRCALAVTRALADLFGPPRKVATDDREWLRMWRITTRVRIVAPDTLKGADNPDQYLFEVLRDVEGADELEVVAEHRVLAEAEAHALVDAAFDAARLSSAPGGQSRTEAHAQIKAAFAQWGST